MKHLYKNLLKCEKIYNDYKNDSNTQQLMLKLACIEVAGWIETALDDLYLKTASCQNAHNEVEEYIKKIYSIKYEQCRKALTFGLGINKIIEIENNVSSQEIVRFKAVLTNIKNLRNSLAHTYNNTTSNYMSFKDLKDNIKIIYIGIKYIESNI